MTHHAHVCLVLPRIYGYSGNSIIFVTLKYNYNFYPKDCPVSYRSSYSKNGSMLPSCLLSEAERHSPNGVRKIYTEDSGKEKSIAVDINSAVRRCFAQQLE